LGRPMNRKERASWIDTEGCITTGIRARGCLASEIIVVQNERDPLDDYVAGAKADGVACRVARHRNSWRVRVYSISNVDREIRLTKRFIRTSKRRQEIKRFYRLVRSRCRATLELERGRLFRRTPEEPLAPVVQSRRGRKARSNSKRYREYVGLSSR
jgi:hypothetical protein